MIYQICLDEIKHKTGHKSLLQLCFSHQRFIFLKHIQNLNKHKQQTLISAISLILSKMLQFANPNPRHLTLLDALSKLSPAMENNGNIRLVHQENSIWVNINFLCVLEFSHYANIKVIKTIFQYIYMAHCISKFPSITTWKLFKRALNTSVDVTCFLHTKLVSTKTQYYQ